jgi:hypothetical protein
VTAPCDAITPETLALPDWATTASAEPDPLPSSEPGVVEPDPLVPSPPLPLAALLPTVGIVISAGSRPAARAITNQHPGPQTGEASFDIKRRFGIDENIVDRTSCWIYDLRDLRMATVLSVLQARYTRETRSDKGDFTRKLEQIKVELDQVLDRVQVRSGPYGNSEEPSTLFSCKLSR